MGMRTRRSAAASAESESPAPSAPTKSARRPRGGKDRKSMAPEDGVNAISSNPKLYNLRRRTYDGSVRLRQHRRTISIDKRTERLYSGSRDMASSWLLADPSPAAL